MLQQPEHDAPPAGSVAGRLDVLIVDDDRGTRDTLVDILGVAGITAEAAGTAAEGIDRRASAVPALAVVDYRLPDATGLELTARLKEADPHLPVIMLTGNASLETAVAAVGLVDEYLTKPVQPEALLRAVRAALERRRLLDENSELLQRLQQANATLEARVQERTDELRADRERLAEAQRIARIGSWEWDLTQGTLSWSDEFARLYGFDPSVTVMGHDDFVRVVAPEDQPMTIATVRHAIEAGEPFTFEQRILLPEGGVRWLQVQGRVEQEEGAPRRLAGTSQDVTERKRAEEQFRDLLESAPDAMVIVAEDGRMILVNRQTERLFGWRRQDLIGQPVEVLLPERLQSAHRHHRAAYQEQPEARAMGAAIDLEARRADGSEFPVEISLSPVQTEDGVLICAAIRDITERKRAEALLAHQALHDALTGLPNRMLLVDRLDQALAIQGRTGDGVAVLFFDVDRFKLLNDSRGHAAGDLLLVQLAQRLRQATRPSDTIARFGGDEFVVICPEAGSVGEALRLAERVSDSVRQPFRVAGEEVFLTISGGIAVSGGDVSAETLLRDADAAMYRAKEQGRARCEFFDETMRTEAAARLEMQNALHRALERDELHVVYQPLVDVASNTTVGVEALVRWQHPERGLITPLSFIPLAEESGLIVPIGAAVLDQATRDFARWRDEPLRPWTVAVNVSGRQLRHPGLVEQVTEALELHGLDPSVLCLELTESVLMEDIDRHMVTLLALRAIGVRLAIDDFGTGYSSLTYLKRFPVDIVKIDRSFVAGLGTDHSDTAIVGSVVELAHALGLLVVAEGIEREDQLLALRSLGCDLAQGYYFARPQPADEVMPTIVRGYGPPARTLRAVKT